MREDIGFYYHEGFSIESSPPALLLAYADADQGGTRLQFHYRIHYSQHPNSKTVITLKSGYSYENKHTTKEITFSDIPKPVINDALAWLRIQVKASGKSGNKNHLRVFLRFIDIIEKGMGTSV